MKKIFRLFLLVVLLTGCQLFDNKLYSTETETIEAFLTALTNNDEQQINRLSNLSSDDKENLVPLVTNYNDCKSTKEKEKYLINCPTTDDQQLSMYVSLEEKKNGYIINDVDYPLC